MSIAIWIAIALVCFVLPATALTQGGNRDPHRGKLAKHAEHVGLPLPEHMVPAVSERIRRRQHGMMMGGTTGIVVATLIYIVFFNNNDGAAPALVFFLAGAGSALGGAWAIAGHHPTAQTTGPTIARMRAVELSDYLTKGERFGFRAVPQALLVGGIGGYFLLSILPDIPGFNSTIIGCGLAVVSLAVWGVSYYASRQILAAPARSASELELAWDDAERAAGLRQVANLSVAAACLSQLFWLILIAEALLFDGFYREHEILAYILAGIALLYYVLVLLVVASGPVTAWITGHRKGYEQRQLWPEGVGS